MELEAAKVCGDHIAIIRHVRFPGFSKASKPRNQKRDFPGIPGIFETIFRSIIALLFS